VLWRREDDDVAPLRVILDVLYGQPLLGEGLGATRPTASQMVAWGFINTLEGEGPS
jgi:hypothetical protein